MSRAESLLQTVNIYRERAKTSLLDCKERFVDVVRRVQNHKEELLIYSGRIAIFSSLVLGLEGFCNDNFVHKSIASVALVTSLSTSAIIERKYNR